MSSDLVNSGIWFGKIHTTRIEIEGCLTDQYRDTVEKINSVAPQHAHILKEVSSTHSIPLHIEGTDFLFWTLDDFGRASFQAIHIHCKEHSSVWIKFHSIFHGIAIADAFAVLRLRGGDLWSLEYL